MRRRRKRGLGGLLLILLSAVGLFPTFFSAGQLFE